MSYCSYCQEYPGAALHKAVEDLHHILLDCQLHEDQDRVLLAYCSITSGWNIANIL